MSIKTTQITCNDETFTRKTYNGFEILVRDEDGYVNGTKMVNDINSRLEKKKQDFKQYIATKCHKDTFETFEQLIHEENSSVGIPTEVKYVLGQKYGEAKGTYVHPMLVNKIAFDYDDTYAYAVSKIMNQVNENIQSGNIGDFEQQILDLEEQRNLLQTKVDSQAKTLSQKEKVIQEYREKLAELEQQQEQYEEQLVESGQKMKESLKKIDETKEKLEKLRNHAVKYNEFQLRVYKVEKNHYYIRCVLEAEPIKSHELQPIKIYKDLPSAKHILHQLKDELDQEDYKDELIEPEESEESDE